MVPGTCYDGFRGLDRFQGSKVRELIPGTIRWIALYRFCSRGLDGTGSDGFWEPKVLHEKVPDSGDSVPKVPKLLCTLKVYFCIRDVYFCTLKSILLYFERALLYTLKVYFVLRKYTVVL